MERGLPEYPTVREYATKDAEMIMRMHEALRPRFWRREVQVNWTNWTVGIWWSSRRARRRLPYPTIGIDLGPLEIVWRKVPAAIAHQSKPKWPVT